MADEDLMRWLDDDAAPCPDADAVAAAAAADAERKRRAHERTVAAAAESRRSDAGGNKSSPTAGADAAAVLAKVHATRRVAASNVGRSRDGGGGGGGPAVVEEEEDVTMSWTTGADFERTARAALARGDFAGAAVAFGKAAKALPDASTGGGEGPSPPSSVRADMLATLRRRLGHGLCLLLTFAAQPSHDLGPTRRGGAGLALPADVAAGLDASSEVAARMAAALSCAAPPGPRDDLQQAAEAEGPAPATMAGMSAALRLEAAAAFALRAEALLVAAQASGRLRRPDVSVTPPPPRRGLELLRGALEAAVSGSAVIEGQARCAADDGDDDDEHRLVLSPALPHGARDVAVWLRRLQCLVRHAVARWEGREERRALRRLSEEVPGTSRVVVADPGAKAPARFGRTLVAAADLPRGAVVLCERALFTFPCPAAATVAADVLAADGSLADAPPSAVSKQALVLRAWGGAPEAVQSAVLSHFTAPDGLGPDAAADEATAEGWELLTLGAAPHQKNDGGRSGRLLLPPDAAGAKRIVALLNNNALSSHPDFGLAAVGRVASMAEHSCVPNCHFVVLPSRGPVVDADAADADEGNVEASTIVFVAARPIAAGERISISYVDPAQPLAARRHTLRTRYAISCTCAACTAGSFDATRPFDCEYCGEGVALPRVTAQELDDGGEKAAADAVAVPTVWRCCPHYTFGANRRTRPCGRRQSDEAAARYSAIERHPEFSRDRPAADVDADALVHAFFAPGHHLVVRAAMAAAGKALRASPGQGEPPARDLSMRWLSHALPAAALTGGRAVHLGGWMSLPEPSSSSEPAADLDAALALTLSEEEEQVAPDGYAALDARGRAQVADGDADPVMAPAKHTADAVAAARLREREERLGLVVSRDASPGLALGLLLLAAQAAERDAVTAAAAAALTDRTPDGDGSLAAFDALDLAHRAVAVCRACAAAGSGTTEPASEREDAAAVVGAGYAALWADEATRVAACDASLASALVSRLTAGALLGGAV